MLDQNDDGSHTITLHNIACPGRPLFPETSGILTWSREKGIEYSITFSGIHSLLGTEFYEQPQSGMRGVGRFAEMQLAHPQWIAQTDDGTEVKLYGISETPSSTSTNGTGGSGVSCSFHGTALYAVVDIPGSRLLAFENSTEEDPGDTKIISVCRVSKANDGGVGGCKSISRGTESQVFRGRAAGKRMKTRSHRDNPNESPQPR